MPLLWENRNLEGGVVVFISPKIQLEKLFDPIFILDVIEPERLIDHLQPVTPGKLVLYGELKINSAFFEDIMRPTPSGRLQLDHTTQPPTPWFKGKTEFRPCFSHSLDRRNRCNVLGENALRCVGRSDIALVPTRYQVYYANGICFPLGGGEFAPSGCVHTLIFDPLPRVLRGSLLECWLVHGGNYKEFQIPPAIRLGKECCLPRYLYKYIWAV